MSNSINVQLILHWFKKSGCDHFTEMNETRKLTALIKKYIFTPSSSHRSLLNYLTNGVGELLSNVPLESNKKLCTYKESMGHQEK